MTEMGVTTLGAKQRLFTRLLPKLLDRIHGAGYECALGEGYVGLSIAHAEHQLGEAVTFAQTLHRRDGGHYKKLAQDVDLFRFNPGTLKFDYVTDTEGHRPFGEFWESLHPLCRWGGRFSDGNHYALEDGGVA